MADDRADLERLISRFLGAVSFEAGQQPAYSELRGLFVAGGRLIRTGPGATECASIEEFIAGLEATFDAGELTSFGENETGEITEIFGNVAHRLSTYHKRSTINGVSSQVRGAISTQFARTADGWRITSMAWDDERPGLQLPQRYETLRGRRRA